MKERLTGAIILVALMVLLVPELLTGPVRTKTAPAASANAASATAAPAGRKAHRQAPLRTYTLTLGPGSSAQAAGPAPDAQAQPAQRAPASPGQAEAESSPEKPLRAKDHPDSTARQQGATLEPPPAARAAAGHAAAGQAASRASGLQAARPPAHPVLREAASSASSRGWVVQLGSFADRQNAVRLARTLEARGFRMSVSPGRAGSRVLWRVRAGPAHDRAGAQHLAARLRALGHRGELLPTG